MSAGALGDRAALRALPGVGPVRAARLARLGIESLRDLLFFAPRRIERAGQLATPAEARARLGAPVTVAGRVRSVRLLFRGGRRSVLRVELEGGGGTLEALFFNQAWMRTRFRPGDDVRLQGSVRATPSGPALVAPRVESGASPLHAPGAWVPRYPATDGLGQAWLRGLAQAAVQRHADELDEPLSSARLAELGLDALPRAVRALHAPESPAAFERARRRVALETALELEARLAARRGARARGNARELRLDAAEHDALAHALPFTPTGGQRAVIADVLADLARSTPMRRLLQGDVGTGKTAVALIAALAVARAGGQSALLAPTELLAEQHALGLAPLLARAGVGSTLLTAGLGARERRAALAEIASGAAAVVFGTHALFSDDVRYRVGGSGGLDLAIVDEQQRFGVAQRARLLEKGRDVHLLLMTATPIPRTLALALYGELDASLLREAPPGRGKRRTELAPASDEALLELCLAHVARGERVFWVAPRIGASESPREPGAASALAAHERLRHSALARFGVELVHGRLAPERRAAALARFRSGKAQVLVGTTVIEVGVDVPEATLMVVEGAERFGLAQLHQLRGRVGRGPRPALCVLCSAPEARARLAVLARSEDGFEIAEEDLRRRGMGDLAGLRQAGENAEGFAGFDELELLLLARRLAAEQPELLQAYTDPAAARSDA